MTLTITTAILFGVALSSIAQDSCPENTVRGFFTAQYPFSLRGRNRVELNFPNASSAQTGWPYVNNSSYVSYLLSFQLPNILVLESKSNQRRHLLIHHQKLDKQYEVRPPNGQDGSLSHDAVFEVHNVLFYCGSSYPLYPDIRTDCYRFNTDNGTWTIESAMKLKKNRLKHVAVTIFGQPCIFSPNITTECLNTTSMTWYENYALPVHDNDKGLGGHRGIVHNDVLYICGLYKDNQRPYDQRQCSRYALEPNGIGMWRYFELFVRDGKVYAAGVVHTAMDTKRNGVMFEVDNPGNKIEIKGPFEDSVFMSICYVF